MLFWILFGICVIGVGTWVIIESHQRILRQGTIIGCGIIFLILITAIMALITLLFSTSYCCSQEKNWEMVNSYNLVEEEKGYYAIADLRQGQLMWDFSYETEIGIETKSVLSTVTRKNVPKNEQPKVIEYRSTIKPSIWFWEIYAYDSKTVLQINKDMIKPYELLSQ